jgi:hypothetical protein
MSEGGLARESGGQCKFSGREECWLVGQHIGGGGGRGVGCGGGVMVDGVGGSMIPGGGCGVVAAHVAVRCLEMVIKGDPGLGLD